MLIAASVVTFQSDRGKLTDLIESLGAAVLHAQQRWPELQVVLTLVSNDVNAAHALAVHELVEQLEAGFPGPIEVIAGHGNIGYGAAHNLAWRTQDADFYLFLNPDLVIEATGLLASLVFFQANPEVVMVTPQGFDPQGCYAYLAKREPNVLVLLLRALGVRPGAGPLAKIVGRYVYAERLPSDQPTEIRHASGCFMFCQGQPLRRVEGFDERYFLYFEDYDLSRRIGRHGSIVELPELTVVHYGGGAFKKGFRQLTHFAASAGTFFLQYGVRLFR